MAVWSPVAVSQGPTAVLVAFGLHQVRHPDHYLGVGLLTTKVPRLGVAPRLGLGLVVAVASCPFRVHLGVAAVALGLAACRRRRGAPWVGT